MKSVILATVFLTVGFRYVTSNDPAEVKFCESGIALPLNPSKNRTQSHFYIPWSPRDARCQWTITGSTDCEVELSCSVDIPDTRAKPGDESSECEEEYLMISDGSVGYHKLCGKKNISKYRPNEGLTDLFVLIDASETALEKSEDSYSTKRFKGVYCNVQCGNPNKKEGVTRPPKNIEKDVDIRCICGLKPAPKDDRIVGGEDSSLMEFPWQAAIVEADTRYPECGASVINDRFILSAAHCFALSDRLPEEINVLVHAFVLDQIKLQEGKDVEWGKKGSIRSAGWNRSAVTDADERTQRYKVLRIINHPLFDKLYDWDYALLQVDRQININGHTKLKGTNNTHNDQITPVCLPPTGSTWQQQTADWKDLNEARLTVSGWGKANQYAGGSTRVLQKLNVPYIADDVCHGWIPNRLTPRMICAGYPDGQKDSCVGDSGGPLVYKMPKTQQFRQMGVVSWGVGCAKVKKPGIYARLTDAMQWIDFHTQRIKTKWCQESLI